MKVGIIGGGASGMMSAILLNRNGIDVTIIEKNSTLGKKILMATIDIKLITYVKYWKVI